MPVLLIITLPLHFQTYFLKSSIIQYKMQPLGGTRSARTHLACTLLFFDKVLYSHLLHLLQFAPQAPQAWLWTWSRKPQCLHL